MMKANIQSSSPVLTAHQTLLVVFLAYQRKLQCIPLYIGLFFPNVFSCPFYTRKLFCQKWNGYKRFLMFTQYLQYT